MAQPPTDDARSRALEQAAVKSRERIKRLALLFADGELDREGYELARSQVQADLQAAEAELARLGNRNAGPTLPPLNEALAELGGWHAALDAGDLTAQREVLRLLVERLDLVKLAFGKFELRVAWSSVGQALNRLRGLGVEAA